MHCSSHCHLPAALDVPTGPHHAHSPAGRLTAAHCAVPTDSTALGRRQRQFRRRHLRGHLRFGLAAARPGREGCWSALADVALYRRVCRHLAVRRSGGGGVGRRAPRRAGRSRSRRRLAVMGRGDGDRVLRVRGVGLQGEKGTEPEGCEQAWTDKNELNIKDEILLKN